MSAFLRRLRNDPTAIAERRWEAEHAALHRAAGTTRPLAQLTAAHLALAADHAPWPQHVLLRAELARRAATAQQRITGELQQLIHHQAVTAARSALT